jgi:acyl-CoA thioester hydrolase
MLTGEDSLNQDSAGTPRHTTHLRVRYAETDQMGVVYYANYLVWMEVGRVELVRAMGLDYKQLEHTEGLFLSVVDVNCRYLYPARYDQEIEVETRLQKGGSRLVEFAYRISSVTPSRLLAEGTTRHIWLNKEMRPAKLPAEYQMLLRVG